ncbi:MAG: hypothetical protein J5818_05445 [Eggerthellaceae bacterium]|nr:hypothetical protein [Eggerthellaceae bacterium]
MKSGVVAKIVSAACVVVLALGILTSCTGGPVTGANEEQQANRSYMSQVNQTMEELDANLDDFVEAVSRGDVVNMRLQAENAYKTLDKLENIETPEDMADIQENYSTGAAKLRKALDAYITLYTEASSDDFDWSKYDTRIAEVQELYDEGVSALEAGDEAAANKA